MPHTLRSARVRYGSVPLFVGGALLIRLCLWPVLGPEIPFLLLWPAVLLVAWCGGLGPGLLATALAMAADDLLFIQPASANGHSLAEWVGMALFGLLGALTSLLADRLRRANRLLEDQAREVARQREWLRVTLASIGDAVIATDAQGRVAFMNVVAQALTGWKEDEALSQPLGQVVQVLDGASRQPVDCPVGRVLREDCKILLAGHLLLPARGGTETPIECSAAPTRSTAGEHLGVVLTVHDFSERHRLEGELRRRAEELAEADRRKDDFLAMLGHELRNPLAPLRNAAQILHLKGSLDAEAQWASDLIDRQVGQMARLVDDLLDVSRITRGKIRLHKQAIELAEVMERAVEMSRPLIEARRHELVESLPPEPVWLEGDPTRLAQVLANLLNNAAKYTNERGRISLWAGRQGAEAVIRVRDNGVGIASEILALVFDPFTQADATLGRSQGGLGVGLTLVKRLVEMHGGTVAAGSDGPGKGSEFVVRLPALAELPRSSQRSTGSSESVTPRRVLIVDDNADAAESLALLLRLRNHDVCTAADGPTALAIAREFRPEVVFLDIGLPGMDGYEVARQLRREPRLDQVMLVALTGYGQEQDRRNSREAGFQHHLVKPVGVNDLQALLARPKPIAQ